MTTLSQERSKDVPLGERVLVLAPVGRDADLASHVAASVGLTTAACSGARELREQCGRGAAALLLTEEGLTAATATTLRDLLDTQPPWSDLAVILCASHGAAMESRVGMIAKLRATTNLTLLERPVRSWMLASTLRAAVRARRRQYEMRDLYQERESVLERETAARHSAEGANRAKDEFLAMVSHELRTPLNAMLGWTKIMRARPMEDAKLAHALEVIERNAESQRRLVEDLLDVSRVLAGEFPLAPSLVRLRGIVDASIEAVAPTAGLKRLVIARAGLEDDDTVVFGDSERLSQVVTNLLTNAVKFTPAGGRITVTLSRDTTWAAIEVADTGEGIASAFLPHVFERFRQADNSRTRAHGGLGLGLTISRALVQLHGGTIEAHSEGKGCGASFVVRLPRAKTSGPVAATERSLALECPPELRGARVLVVDDEAEAREMVDFVLSSCGLAVHTAASADEGMRELRNWRPDVIVSDVAMPGTDGFQFLQQVRRLSPDDGGLTPAIAVTALASAADRQRALAAGFTSHVAKPLSFSDLLAALFEALPPQTAKGLPATSS